MARLQFGTSAFERARGDLPSLPVVNMFAEATPTEEIGLALQSRPGLDGFIYMGSGPIRQMFSGEGVLDDGIYGVSGNDLYAGTTLLGTIDGSGPVSLDGYSNLLFAAAGGGLWSWDMSTLTNVSFPDSANVRKVIVGASRAICIRDDTEKFYWSDVLTDTIDPLSFATAESQPDRLRDMLFIDDVLVLFGAETVEFWPNTSDPDLPFQPLEGRVFEYGVKATGCAVKFLDTFAWVTHLNQVCMSSPDQVISNPGLEALVEASTGARLFTFNIGGEQFLALRIDAGTWVYSRSGKWSQFETYGLDTWEIQSHARGYFGSSIDGGIYQWGTSYLDYDAGLTIERRFRAGLPIDSSPVVVSNVILRTNPGRTTYLVDDPGSPGVNFVEPAVEMRRSLDAGKTWGTWKPRSLGVQGEYRKKVQWTACGMFGQPGIILEFRCTDPVDFRVSDVRVNEPFSGF